MARFILLCYLFLCVSAATSAADVHKCATAAGITYQGVPCDGVELPTSTAIASAPQTAPTLRSSAANGATARTTPDCGATPQRASRRLPWRHTAICIGMTDDEVLNLPGWGRPARIVRTRAPREWREEWSYDARAAGLRQLFFVNGKLAAAETDLVEVAIGPMARLVSN